MIPSHFLLLSNKFGTSPFFIWKSNTKYHNQIHYYVQHYNECCQYGPLTLVLMFPLHHTIVASMKLNNIFLLRLSFTTIRNIHFLCDSQFSNSFIPILSYLHVVIVLLLKKTRTMIILKYL